MITHVQAFPKVAMSDMKERIDALDDRAVISIIDPGAPRIWDRNTHRILTLEFSDLEPTSFLRGSWFHGTKDCYMSTKQAEQAFAFIRSLVLDDKEWRLLINCSAGICRSGAIATFAQVFSSMKDTDFISVNPQIKPNQWVLCKLIEVWDRDNPKLVRNCEYESDDIF